MGYQLDYSVSGGVLMVTISGSCPTPGAIARDIGREARENALRNVLVDVRRLEDRIGKIRDLLADQDGPKRIAVLDNVLLGEQVTDLADAVLQAAHVDQHVARRVLARLAADVARDGAGRRTAARDRHHQHAAAYAVVQAITHTETKLPSRGCPGGKALLGQFQGKTA